MKEVLWVSLVLALCSFINVVNAELMLRPPGLEDGDQYRLVFTTSETTAALAVDIAFYNDFVQGAADAAPVVGSWELEWKALMSTTDVNVRVNTETEPGDLDVPIYRVDGLMVADGYEHLYGNTISVYHNPMGLTELDSVPSTSRSAWTGTLLGGRTGRAPRGGTRSVTTGISLATATDLAIQLGDTLSGAQQARLYAISEVITAVPEPSAAVLLPWLLPAAWVLRSSRQEMRKR